MQCKQCFCELPDDSNFCPNCRADQRVNVQAPETQGFDDISGDASKNGYAVSSLVTAIATITCCGMPFFSIISIILGIMGLKSQKRGMSVAGIVISSIGLLLFVVLMIVYMASIPAILEYLQENGYLEMNY